MSENKKISRRDFLKLGALAAISLPTINEIGHLGDYSLLESHEEYGGFLIRKLSKDQPPYEVDNSIYKRFDAKDTAFGRFVWDKEAQKESLSNQHSDVEMIESGEPGFHKEDFALLGASWTLANAFETNAGMHGLQKGLFKLEPFKTGMVSQEAIDLPWDRERLTDEEVARMVKKAAKFFGASLVGITDLDERWIYQRSFNMMNPKEAGDIIFTDVENIELPAGQVTPSEGKKQIQAKLSGMDPDSLKEFIIEAMQDIDPSTMPSDAPSPDMIIAMPASQLAQMLPQMMGSLPIGAFKLFAKKLDLPFEISDVDPAASRRPHYLEDGVTLVIPKTMKWVVVMAFEMDRDAIEAYPTAIGAAGAGNGYSRLTFTANALAEFIRNLGYNAIPAGNMTGLSIPMAVDAGLGELGRNGILITPKYGPRVRIAKVITDMPLLTDQPISFGVTEFCEICGKCADYCPGQAISHEGRTFEPNNISNNPGVKKWPIDAPKCFGVWMSLGFSDCGTCIRVCPFNKPEGWLHEATRILIGAKSGSLDKILLNLDNASGYGEAEENPEDFWKKDNYIQIKN